MTRQDIEKSYELNRFGGIRSLGKFEGEMLYVPYFWDAALQGMFDMDIAGVFFVPFDTEDRRMFPEIGRAWGIAMEESEQGFVNTVEYDTQAEYNAAIAKLEALEMTETDEESA